MKLRMKYSAQLRTALQRGEETLELPDGSGLAAVLEHLARTDDAARPHLMSPAGQLHASLLIVVNDAAIPAREAASHLLRDGDTILLLPPIAGG
jgi:molybdopterin converting factor small subunit